LKGVLMQVPEVSKRRFSYTRAGKAQAGHKNTQASDGIPWQ